METFFVHAPFVYTVTIKTHMRKSIRFEDAIESGNFKKRYKINDNLPHVNAENA